MAHPIDALPDLLSLDATAALVKAGMRAPWKQGANVGDPATYTLDVLDASNTSPIVITVPANSFTVSDAAIGVRTGRVMHVVIAGVLGNTAANKLDDKPQRNEAWYGVITSPTTLALYDVNNRTGEVTASVGNGVYAGGGTVSKAFRDGRILVGREFISEESSPPRVVFVPAFVEDGPAGMTSAMSALAFSDGEVDAQRLSPPFRSELLWYEVHIWGKEGAPFGPTLAIAEQLKRSAQERASACYEVGRGDWRDQHPDAPQRTKIGRNFVFNLGLRIPVTRDAVTFAPLDTETALTMQLQIGDGTPEQA